MYWIRVYPSNRWCIGSGCITAIDDVLDQGLSQQKMMFWIRVYTKLAPLSTPNLRKPWSHCQGFQAYYFLLFTKTGFHFGTSWKKKNRKIKSTILLNISNTSMSLHNEGRFLKMFQVFLTHVHMIQQTSPHLHVRNGIGQKTLTVVAGLYHLS